MKEAATGAVQSASHAVKSTANEVDKSVKSTTHVVTNAVAESAKTVEKTAKAVGKAVCKAVVVVVDTVVAGVVSSVGKWGVDMVVSAGKWVAGGLGELSKLFDIYKMYYKGSARAIFKGNLGKLELKMKLLEKDFELKVNMDVEKLWEELKHEALKIVDEIIARKFPSIGAPIV